MTVASILSEKGTEVVTVTVGVSLADVAATLAGHRIGAVVITDERGRMCGIVSERDVVAVLADEGAHALGRAVGEIMTRDDVTCALDETSNMVMERMTKRRCRHLPVVERGRLVGIISIGDVVKRRIEDVVREAEEMRVYIASA